jgi:hypothetical protein
MTSAHHRHDTSDRVWSLLEPHLPGRAGRWGAEHVTTGYASPPYTGFCGQAPHGAICRRIMAIGSIRTAGFAAGVIAASGRRCYNSWWMRRILHG